mmetsp:Transcript_65121/g.121370  ORF Transcript_65121/g.121370 Transcript_65121/m.121370 type:complete len:454 (-) Transcript_65121:587-1948(-)
MFSHAAKGLLGSTFCGVGTIFLSGLGARCAASGSVVWDDGHSARLRITSLATTCTLDVVSMDAGTGCAPGPSAVLRKLAFKTSHWPAVSMLLWQRFRASCSAWHWRSFRKRRWLSEAARFRNAPRRGVLVGLCLLLCSSAWESPCASALNVGKASSSSAAACSRSSCIKPPPSFRSGEGNVDTVECDALIPLNKDGVKGDNCRLWSCTTPTGSAPSLGLSTGVAQAASSTKARLPCFTCSEHTAASLCVGATLRSTQCTRQVAPCAASWLSSSASCSSSPDAATCWREATGASQLSALPRSPASGSSMSNLAIIEGSRRAKGGVCVLASCRRVTPTGWAMFSCAARQLGKALHRTPSCTITADLSKTGVSGSTTSARLSSVVVGVSTPAQAFVEPEATATGTAGKVFLKIRSDKSRATTAVVHCGADGKGLAGASAARQLLVCTPPLASVGQG